MALRRIRIKRWRHEPRVKTERLAWYHNPRVMVGIIAGAFALVILLATLLTEPDKTAGVTTFLGPYWPFGMNG